MQSENDWWFQGGRESVWAANKGGGEEEEGNEKRFQRQEPEVKMSVFVEKALFYLNIFVVGNWRKK